MNLDRAQRLLSKFSIRDLHSNARVPFIFKKNQIKLQAAAAKQQDAGKPIRLIVDKARRTGCSSWAEGILFCHGLAIPGAHALIAAHQHKSSEALFSIPKGFVKQAPFLSVKAIERKIVFPHRDGDSILQIVTAGKDTTGRGFTLSALHLSEGAHYKDPDIYASIIPAVSNHKETIIVIESTPNGMDGDGEAFYEMWMDAVEGKSDYEWVFLSWLDDDQCVADPELAKNAPIDKEEKDLLKRKVTRAQLAWRRLKISSPECGGLIELFHQEYPTTPEESFVTSGFPAFEESERQWASANLMEPKWRGFLERTTDGTMSLREHYKGDLSIWADPVPGHYYYIGADAARGDNEKDGRDFAANVGFDGTTGLQAFRYSGYVVPEVHGCYLNSLGRHYNRAMVNGEVTGGYGYGTLYTLRDILQYPNLFKWKGKDDKVGTWATGRNSVWFETTQHTRTQLFEMFRVSLREAIGTAGEYGITIYDDLLATQVRMCTRKETGRIDVKKGHDDVLFAAMLANISMRQWAPPRVSNASLSMVKEEEVEAIGMMKKRGYQVLDDPMVEKDGKIYYMAPVAHRQKIERITDRFPNEDEYEEVVGTS